METNKSNFTAFKFCDNDFHGPLREAIEYVVENRTEELTLESFKEFVLRGMVAFNSISRIDNWALTHQGQDNGPEYGRYRKYFEETLKVCEVNSLDELGNFEGYVFDKNLFTVFYQGY